jgi:hypothetical protein
MITWYGLADNDRHVIQRILDPRCLSLMTFDVVGNVCQLCSAF